MRVPGVVRLRFAVAGAAFAVAALAFVCVLSSPPAAALPAQTSGSTTTTAPAASATSTATTVAPATSGTGSNTAEGWLAFASILFGAGVSFGLLWMVMRDRTQAREKSLDALKAGARSVTETDTSVAASRALVPAAGLKVTSTQSSFGVGDTAVLTASDGTNPVPCSWAFDPTDVVSAACTGPISSIVVSGLKAGSVKATATNTAATPATTGDVSLTVTAAAGSTISFSSLGAGVGTVVLAILAVTGAVALAFEGQFTAEVGTLLGTALGAGAAGTVSALHSSGSGGSTSGGASSSTGS